MLLLWHPRKNLRVDSLGMLWDYRIWNIPCSSLKMMELKTPHTVERGQRLRPPHVGLVGLGRPVIQFFYLAVRVQFVPARCQLWTTFANILGLTCAIRGTSRLESAGATTSAVFHIFFLIKAYSVLVQKEWETANRWRHIALRQQWMVCLSTKTGRGAGSWKAMTSLENRCHTVEIETMLY